MYWADSSGRRNSSIERGCDGQRRGGRADRAGRPAMRSPGRPPVGRREHRQRFWAAIARGLSQRGGRGRGGRVAGGRRPVVSGGWRDAVRSRWLRLSGRYLSFAEREEIAMLRAGGAGVREIARRLGRSPSTISRELRRNAATRGGGLEYRATTAQWHADQRARRPKPAKLAVNERVARAMCRTGWPARCSVPTGSRSTVRRSRGSAGAMAAARIGAGRGRGARSRSPTGCAWTSPMMSRCASRMRRSISRSMSRAAARSGAS